MPSPTNRLRLPRADHIVDKPGEGTADARHENRVLQRAAVCRIPEVPRVQRIDEQQEHVRVFRQHRRQVVRLDEEPRFRLRSKARERPAPDDVLNRVDCENKRPFRVNSPATSARTVTVTDLLITRL